MLAALRANKKDENEDEELAIYFADNKSDVIVCSLPSWLVISPIRSCAPALSGRGCVK